MDIVTRKRAARTAAVDGGSHWLDVCSGTGELAGYLNRYSRNGTKIFAADFSYPMLSLARAKPFGNKINFTLSEAGKLPFGDGTFDLITISYATRNLNSTPEGLLHHFSEFNRVLKPGGRFVNLETSQPESSVMRKLVHLYVKLTVAPIGGLISGSGAGYRYLSGSIRSFYTAEQLAEILLMAGFSEVTFKRQFFGVSAIHKAVK
jgi:demethylmenaquinone methyltransferase/2-methoxy-6-polyprenyl-1,4-benzoquinol methylase